MPGKVGTSVTLITCMLAICLAQDTHMSVVVVMDVGDNAAEEAAAAAMDYLELSTGTNIGKSMVDLGGLQAKTDVAKVCNHLDSMIDAGTPPDLVLDLTKAGISNSVVNEISLALALPTVSSSHWDEESAEMWTVDTEGFFIHVRPPGDLLPMIIRDLAEHMNLTNLGIIYDSTFIMDYHLTALIRDQPIRVVINEVETWGIKDQLHRINDRDEINNYFILGSPATLLKVFQTASDLLMSGDRHTWFAGTKESDFEFDPSCCNAMKVTLFSPTLPPSAMHSKFSPKSNPKIEAGFYYDLAVRAMTTVHNIKSEGSWPEMTYAKCSDFASESPVNRSLDLDTTMKALSIPDVYGPFILNSNGFSYMGFSLKLVAYTINSGEVAERQNIGTWSAGIPSGQLTIETDMEGHLKAGKIILKVVTVLQSPFMMWNTTKNNYEGFCYDMLIDVAKKMNFEWEIYVAPGNKYGEMDENEEWDGLVGELVNHRADVAFAAVSVMAEREDVIDYTVPWYDLVGLSVMIKKVKRPTNLFMFLTVMDGKVWGCIMAAWLITSVYMWLIDWYSPFSYQNNMDMFNEEDDEDHRFFNLKESLWFCMTSMTPQGGGEAPRTYSSRLVAATWWLYSFILIASYTSNLAAFLTMEKLEEPVTGLKDLSRQFKIQYAPIEGSQAAKYFERMPYIEEQFYEVWRKITMDDSHTEEERDKLTIYEYPIDNKYAMIWKFMLKSGLPVDWDDAVRRVRSSTKVTEGFAFIGDATDIKWAAWTNCDLIQVGNEFSRKPYALAVPQNSPLTDQLTDSILRLLDERRLERYKLDWWNWNPNKANCENLGQSSGISIDNIGGVFIVIFSGIFLASITLYFEWWYYTKKSPYFSENRDLLDKANSRKMK